MRILLAVAIGLLLLGAILARADSAPQAAFARANEAYAAGDYREAAEELHSLLEKGVVSSALLYDLGNAHAKDGRPGPAILAYECALSLAPRDPDILANLRQTRSAANLPEPERDRWQAIAATGTVDDWAWAAIAGVVLTCLAIARHALRIDEDRPPSRALVATGLVGLVAAAAATGLCLSRLEELDRSVLIAEAPALRVAPFETATISTELPSGLIVDVERRHDDFALVRTDDGQAGWMPGADVAEILPP